MNNGGTLKLYAAGVTSALVTGLIFYLSSFSQFISREDARDEVTRVVAARISADKLMGRDEIYQEIDKRIDARLGILNERLNNVSWQLSQIGTLTTEAKDERKQLLTAMSEIVRFVAEERKARKNEK